MSKPRTILCPCCGFRYSRRQYCAKMCSACLYANVQPSYADDHRKVWIEDGMRWLSNIHPKPGNWDPLQTLARLALSKTLGRVRGRRPRLNP